MDTNDPTEGTPDEAETAEPGKPTEEEVASSDTPIDGADELPDEVAAGDASADD